MKLQCVCGEEMKENGTTAKSSMSQTLYKCGCGFTGLVLSYTVAGKEPDYYIKDLKGKLVRYGQIQVAE